MNLSNVFVTPAFIAYKNAVIILTVILILLLFDITMEIRAIMFLISKFSN